MGPYRNCYLGALISSATVSWLAMSGWFGPGYVAVWGWAFLLTVTLGSLVFYIHARLIKEGQVRFLYWGLGIHGARVVVLLSLFLLLHVLRVRGLLPFIAATVAGYFCFLFFEIAGLHLGNRGVERNRG